MPSLTPAERVAALRKRHRKTYDAVMGGARILDWNDVLGMLEGLGCIMVHGSGSRVKISHPDLPQVLQLHEPHGGRKTVIHWAIQQTRDFLHLAGFILKEDKA